VRHPSFHIHFLAFDFYVSTGFKREFFGTFDSDAVLISRDRVSVLALDDKQYRDFFHLDLDRVEPIGFATATGSSDTALHPLAKLFPR